MTLCHCWAFRQVACPLNPPHFFKTSLLCVLIMSITSCTAKPFCTGQSPWSTAVFQMAEAVWIPCRQHRTGERRHTQCHVASQGGNQRITHMLREQHLPCERL